MTIENTKTKTFGIAKHSLGHSLVRVWSRLCLVENNSQTGSQPQSDHQTGPQPQSGHQTGSRLQCQTELMFKANLDADAALATLAATNVAVDLEDIADRTTYRWQIEVRDLMRFHLPHECLLVLAVQ